MIVVDSNIIFSALVSKNSAIFDTLNSKKHQFITPKFAIIELFKYKEKIIKCSKHTNDEILEIFYVLLKNIEIYDEELISGDSIKKAFELIGTIDEKDTLFVALSIELNAELWSGDKKINDALVERGFYKIFKQATSSI